MKPKVSAPAEKDGADSAAAMAADVIGQDEPAIKTSDAPDLPDSVSQPVMPQVFDPAQLLDAMRMQDAAFARTHLEDDAPVETLVDFLVFRLGREELGIRIAEIEEILKGQKTTLVPRTKPFVVGVTSMRGTIIPVIDIRGRLVLGGDRPEVAPADVKQNKQKILILRGPKGPIGILVEGTIDIIWLPESALKPPPGHLEEQDVKFIESVAIVGGRFISIINCGELLKFSPAMEG